ncbi:MAG: fibronectin type III domain-containing protein [bacterium]
MKKLFVFLPILCIPFLVPSCAVAAWNIIDIGSGTSQMNGIAVGEGKNDAVNRIYAANADSLVYELTYDSGWTKADLGTVNCGGVQCSAVAVGAGRGDAANRFYASGSDGSLYELSYSVSWTSDTVAAIGGDPFGVAIGYGRNDGKNRIYSAFSGAVHEFTYNSGWSVSDLSPWGNDFIGLGVGNGHNDGTERVYTGSSDGSVREWTYDMAWTSAPVGAVAGAVNGLAVGNGRNDGVSRIYAAVQNGHIYEFSNEGGGWSVVDIGSGTSPMNGVAVGAGKNDGINRVYASCGDWHVYEFTESLAATPRPAPASNLMVAAAGGRKLRLDWTLSSSATVVRYSIYYDNALGTVDYSTLLSSVPSSADFFLTPPLTEGLAYKIGLRAENENGLEEKNTNVAASAVVSPTEPALVSLLAESTSQITAGWTDTSYTEDWFIVYYGNTPGGGISGPSVATTNKTGTGGFYQRTLTGLNPNRRYYVYIHSYINPQTDVLSLPSNEMNVVTLAARPDNLSVSAIHVSSVALTWDANGNPSGTLYEIVSSTDEFLTAFSTATAAGTGGAAESAVPSGLVTGATHYFKVRAKNFDNAATLFTSTVSAFLPKVPLPPSGLTAIVQEGSDIILQWQPSPSGDVLGYEIYWNGGTGDINYQVRMTSAAAGVSSFTVSHAVAGQTYCFGIRARGDNGMEEKNTAAAASVFVPAASGSSAGAVIRNPGSGRSIGGDHVTVEAEVFRGSSGQVRSIEFQYRSLSPPSGWIAIPAAGGTVHPNPDDSPPYFIHWNVTGLASGNYELRALVLDTSGNTDPAPPAITIMVDNTAPDIEEKLTGGALIRRETIYSTLPGTVKLGNPQTESVTKIDLPAGAVTGFSAVIRIEVNPAGPATPSPPAPPSSTLQIFKIDLENGQTLLSNGRAATITIDYPDADGDGIIDGTAAVGRERLGIHRFDALSGRWEKLPGSLDPSAKTISAQTGRFSVFALFAPAASSLSDILVYPVPWVPNDGQNDNGKPFNAGDPDSGIIFDNLTSNVRIRVFTVSGELVWEKESSDSTGRIQWDGRNRSGRAVASGGYFAVISDTAAGSKVTRKIAVIR